MLLRIYLIKIIFMRGKKMISMVPKGGAREASDLKQLSQKSCCSSANA